MAATMLILEGYPPSCRSSALQGTRLHSAIGYVTPQEAEEGYHENLNVDEKQPNY